MLKISYQYVESKVAPGLSFISKALGISGAFAILLGIRFIFMSGYFTYGICALIIGALIMIGSHFYNQNAEKEIMDIIQKHPEKAIKITYEGAIQELHDSFSRKEIDEKEFSIKKEQLENEMVEAIREYVPDYNLGDRL